MATQIDPRYPEMLPGAGSFVTFKRAPGPLVDFSRPALGQPHAGRGLSEHSAKNSAKDADVMARAKIGNAEFVHADMTMAELPEGSFDGIAAFYSITHIPADEHGTLLQPRRNGCSLKGVFVGFGPARRTVGCDSGLGRPFASATIKRPPASPCLSGRALRWRSTRTTRMPSSGSLRRKL